MTISKLGLELRPFVGGREEYTTMSHELYPSRPKENEVVIIRETVYIINKCGLNHSDVSLYKGFLERKKYDQLTHRYTKSAILDNLDKVRELEIKYEIAKNKRDRAIFKRPFTEEVHTTLLNQSLFESFELVDSILSDDNAKISEIFNARKLYESSLIVLDKEVKLIIQNLKNNIRRVKCF